MSYLERAKTVTAEVSANLWPLQELHEAIDSIYKNEPSDELRENPLLYIGRSFIGYLRITKDLATLSPKDVDLIRQANRLSVERGISTNNAGHGGADHLLEVLGSERRAILLDTVLKSADVTAPTFKEGLNDLVNRMAEGSELAAANIQTADGASAKADHAIWGHTKGLHPKAMMHFVMIHFLQRVFTAQFTNDQDPSVRELVSGKDSLQAAMGDVMRLEKARGVVDPEIIKIWENSRENGGLGWNRSERQAIYDEVVTQQVS